MSSKIERGLKCVEWSLAVVLTRQLPNPCRVTILNERLAPGGCIAGARWYQLGCYCKPAADLRLREHGIVLRYPPAANRWALTDSGRRRAVICKDRTFRA